MGTGQIHDLPGGGLEVAQIAGAHAERPRGCRGRRYDDLSRRPVSDGGSACAEGKEAQDDSVQADAPAVGGGSPPRQGLRGRQPLHEHPGREDSRPSVHRTHGQPLLDCDRWDWSAARPAIETLTLAQGLARHNVLHSRERGPGRLIQSPGHEPDQGLERSLPGRPANPEPSPKRFAHPQWCNMRAPPPEMAAVFTGEQVTVCPSVRIFKWVWRSFSSVTAWMAARAGASAERKPCFACGHFDPAATSTSTGRITKRRSISATTLPAMRGARCPRSAGASPASGASIEPPRALSGVGSKRGAPKCSSTGNRSSRALRTSKGKSRLTAVHIPGKGSPIGGAPGALRAALIDTSPKEALVFGTPVRLT
jgi:hypothetical protein